MARHFELHSALRGRAIPTLESIRQRFIKNGNPEAAYAVQFWIEREREEPYNQPEKGKA